ncbi:hypothetical protein PV08_03163 [Exophiala spinifera]|uniref:GAT domain-containing protein n=1 Tax=Exophiala spinifera TaxID=91928 RepID=A0A0D2C5M7_9EURO|nr:uncharacterized protein PV08_03163 [Exophiala spinifera]KIW18874.1 hypothetical protein PV08_03163 [Exophiala spinifera]
MKKLLGNIKKKNDSPERNGSSPVVLPQGDSPEAVVVREMTAFCESGAPNSSSAGDEYLHLPAIVDAAESSPTAAKEAAATLRRFLSKENYPRGYAQYNAVMLARILTDNPGPVFTQNFDAKFVHTVKELLRDGRDKSVQQILRETLDYFEFEKAPGNDTLGPLMEMWRKEKGKRNTIRPSVGWASMEAVGPDHLADGQQNYRVPPPPLAGQYQYQHHGNGHRREDFLPPPEELAARIEEAKTTARLLVQTVQSTPQSELLANELVTEFADRAKNAQRSIQKIMNCQNPAPDPDTMLTLIETNDQLNIAMSKHQRAILQARRSSGLATPSPHAETPQSSAAMPQHNLGQNVYSSGSLHDNRPYPTSPPRRQDTVPSPVSPPRQETPEHFEPPPGPPSGFRGPVRAPPPSTEYDYADAYSAPEQAPPIPQRVRPQSQSYAYGVPENPFTDDAYGQTGVQQQPSRNLIDLGEDTPSTQPQGNQFSNESSVAQSRPGPYGTDYQPTQSYMARQDSSAAHLTMHGGTPPSSAGNQTQTNGAYGSSPVSPVDERETVGRRMNDMRI